MKKILLLFAVILSAGAARADVFDDRVGEVKKYFLHEAGLKASVIHQGIEALRAELDIGFRPPEEIVPPLKDSDLHTVVIFSESYTGNYGDAGYENGQVLVVVTGLQTYYGGRIDEQRTVSFICDYKSAYSGRADIKCKPISFGKN